MLLARWSIDAKFGHKQDVTESMKRWLTDIGSQIGWTPDRTRLLGGSIGAGESTVVSEILVEDLADLDKAWKTLGTIAAHKAWSRDLEPHMVSGSTRWEIFRVL